MEVKIFEGNRKDVALELSKRLGIKCEYLGAPSFSYQVGDYLIRKDSVIEVDDARADKELLREISSRGKIDDSFDAGRDTMNISLPIKPHTGQTLTNLVRMLYSRAESINRAIGCKGAFAVSKSFVDKLESEPVESDKDFFESWKAAGGTKVTKGIEFDEKVIHFTGFPAILEPETVRAYTDLVAAINNLALNMKRANIVKPDLSNEKYSFRVWLLRLGLTGDDFKQTRKVLLSKLSGNVSFKNEASKQRAISKRKAEKEEKEEKA